jgi:hypothetical protein
VKKITLQNQGRLAVAVAVACLAMAGRAQAHCGITANQFSVIPRLAVATMPAGMSAASVAKDTDASAPAATSATEDRRNNNADPSIVGLWKTTFTSGGQVVDEGFDQWSSDGTEVLNDDPPPQTGNVCLGVYVKSALSTYKLKHPSWTFDASGNVNGTAIIRELVSMGQGGNTYSGTYTIDVYDLDGNHLTQFGGTITATRITVDF